MHEVTCFELHLGVVNMTAGFVLCSIESQSGCRATCQLNRILTCVDRRDVVDRAWGGGVVAHLPLQQALQLLHLALQALHLSLPMPLPCICLGLHNSQLQLRSSSTTIQSGFCGNPGMCSVTSV